MRSKRITLTKSVKQEIAFSIDRHIADIRLSWLRNYISGNDTFSLLHRDAVLNDLSGDLLADINRILGIDEPNNT